jgi:hypothetical protein
MSKYYGKYRAVVGDNHDPLGGGRLHVSLSAHGLEGWAVACLPPVPAALVVMPAVGMIVWVEFEDGDPSQPVWTGVTWAAASGGETSVVSAGPVRVSAPTVTVSASVVRLDAGMVESPGVLKCDTLMANSVVAASYTPGAGNQL